MNAAGMTITYRIDLDAPQNVVWIGTLLVQGDDSAHKIVAELYRGREKHNPANDVTALGVFVRSDGYAVALGGEIAGNTVTIALDGACYAVAGPCYLSIVLNDQGGERTVMKAAGRVDQDENNGYIDETVYTSFDALVEAAVNAYLGGSLPEGGGSGTITGPYVSTINGQSGDVTLDAEAVGALPASTQIPGKTSELTNDSGYITKAVSDLTNYYLKSETYTREEINQRISQIPKFAISVVSALPTSGDDTTIYLVGGGISGDLYTEYIWANGAWEMLGSQRVDLTGYATETWVTGQLGSYLKASELETAINTALAQAAASGEFDGADGVGIAGVSVTREPDEYGYYYITVELTDGQVQVIPYRNGTDGEPGNPGYTPVKGEDYFTPEEVAEIKTEVNNNSENFIATELAKRGQIKPEFANSIEECVDTTKLYVLPDGNIYAYMSVTGPMFTDQVQNAIDADGTPYNGGLGFKTGWRFGAALTQGVTWQSGTGQAGDRPNGAITGLIPYNPAKNKVIRVSGFERAYDSDCYILFFDANYTAIEQRGRIEYYIENYGQTYADEPAFNNEVKTFTFDIDLFTTKSSYYSGLIKDNAKYVAFSVSYANVEALKVTFDEEIAFGTSTRWMNTGHAFVPADYEDRIIAVEQASESHENRIRTLEMYGADSTSGEEIPAYIKTAADEVIAKVLAQQGNRAFNMVALSDIHYSGTGNNKDNLIRACKAISYIANRIHVDAIASLGDNLPYGSEYSDSIRANADRWSKEINEILAVTQKTGVVDFRTPGNHDRFGTTELYMPDNAIYSFITGYNRQCEIGNVPGGWAYRDFSGHKLRVIVLNTAETEGKGRFSINSGYHMSTAQYNWLIDTLDLSGKSDASDWQIMLLSHHRADDWQVAAKGDTTYILPNILNAYKTGGSYTGVNAEDNATISCNFAGKNAAKLIGQIHGHHHAYIYGYLGLSNGGTQTNVMAISTPTTGFGTGEGHNDDNDGNWYDSIKDSAEETAFCLYSIDLDNHVVNAIHYGNGIDRVIDY